MDISFLITFRCFMCYSCNNLRKLTDFLNNFEGFDLIYHKPPRQCFFYLYFIRVEYSIYLFGPGPGGRSRNRNYPVGLNRTVTCRSDNFKDSMEYICSHKLINIYNIYNIQIFLRLNYFRKTVRNLEKIVN